MPIAFELFEIRSHHRAGAPRFVLNCDGQIYKASGLENALHQPRHAVGATARRAIDDDLDRTLGHPALRRSGQRYADEQCRGKQDVEFH
jgi:hypothetical protein